MCFTQSLPTIRSKKFFRFHFTHCSSLPGRTQQSQELLKVAPRKKILNIDCCSHNRLQSCNQPKNLHVSFHHKFCKTREALSSMLRQVRPQFIVNFFAWSLGRMVSATSGYLRLLSGMCAKTSAFPNHIDSPRSKAFPPSVAAAHGTAAIIIPSLRDCQNTIHPINRHTVPHVDDTRAGLQQSTVRCVNIVDRQ
jgi:hypothetical protein